MESSTNNLAGHRAKYDHLRSTIAQEDVGPAFVGGGDAHMTGYHELETLRNQKNLKGAYIVDVGCWIGRLTKYLLRENIGEYLGIDIIQEILLDAITAAQGHPEFQFAIGENLKVPRPAKSADIVCGFSLITHLLDEEIFECFMEARRVLRSDGVGVFSFMDFDNPQHRPAFFVHAKNHRHGHGDLLKFNTKQILTIFALEAGFSAVRFIDSGIAPLGASACSTLLDGRAAPKIIQLGQSVCVMDA